MTLLARKVLKISRCTFSGTPGILCLCIMSCLYSPSHLIPHQGSEELFYTEPLPMRSSTSSQPSPGHGHHHAPSLRSHPHRIPRSRPLDDDDQDMEVEEVREAVIKHYIVRGQLSTFGGPVGISELPTVTKKSYLLRNLEGNTKIRKCIQKVRFWRHTEPNVTAIHFRP